MPNRPAAMISACSRRAVPPLRPARPAPAERPGQLTEPVLDQLRPVEVGLDQLVLERRHVPSLVVRSGLTEPHPVQLPSFSRTRHPADQVGDPLSRQSAPDPATALHSCRTPIPKVSISKIVPFPKLTARSTGIKGLTTVNVTVVTSPQLPDVVRNLRNVDRTGAIAVRQPQRAGHLRKARPWSPSGSPEDHSSAYWAPVSARASSARVRAAPTPPAAVASRPFQVWVLQEESQQVAHNGALARFNKNSDVKARLVATSNDGYTDKLHVSMGSSNKPDVFYNWGGGSIRTTPATACSSTSARTSRRTRRGRTSSSRRCWTPA